MYEELNLREWPFQIVPDENFAKVWAGRQRSKEELERLLRRIILFPKSGIYVLWANFGMGKTHTLLYIKHRCEDNRENLIPIFVVMPKKVNGFIDLYRAIVQELPFDYLNKQLRELGKGLSEGIALQPMFYKAPGIVNALLAMHSRDIERTLKAKMWLQGTTGLTSSEMRTIGVINRIKSPEDSLAALNALIKLALFGNEQKRIIFMIDEFQRIGELREKTLSEINSCLRSLYNENPQQIEIILSFSFGKKENVDFLLSSELKSVIQPHSITLDYLSVTEGKEFLIDLFQNFRIHENNNVTFPFTSDCIIKLLQYIESKKKITPRRIMLYANHALENYMVEKTISAEGIGFQEIEDYLVDPHLGISDIDNPN